MDDWEPLKLAKESKTFCVMPWIHQFTNQVSKVKLCCLDSDKPIGDLSKNTLKELWNSENIKQISEWAKLYPDCKEADSSAIKPNLTIRLLISWIAVFEFDILFV